MADYSYLARYDTVLSDFSGTGYSGHGCHGGVGTHTHIVRYLAKVVYSHAVFNDGGLHRSLVDAGVGADFHVIANDYIAYVFNLLPSSVALRGIAEAVIADNATGVEYGPVTDDGVRENVNARIDDAFFSYPDILSYSDIVVNLREVSDHSLFPNGHKVTDPDLLSEFCTPGYTAAAAVAFVAFLLGIDIVQQLREGSVGAFHAHQGRSDRCTRLEILVYKVEKFTCRAVSVHSMFLPC